MPKKRLKIHFVELFLFKPGDDVQGAIICEQCFGIVAAL